MTDENYEKYLQGLTAENVLSMDSFAIAYAAPDAIVAARRVMLADRAGVLGKNIEEFNAAHDEALELRRAGKLLAPADRDVFGRARAAPATHLSTLSAPELRCVTLPPVQYIVQDILPVGVTILSAASKVGKSWMVLDLGLKIASGTPFMGHDTTQCGVLYLALEDSWNRLQDRMNKVLRGKPAPPSFYFATDAPTLDANLLQALDAQVTEHPEIRQIIVDTMQKVRGPIPRNEAPYAYDYREVGNIKKHFEPQGIGTLFVHHNRKRADDDDPFNMISGTTGIMGAADTIWVITKGKRTDETATLDITGRDVQQSRTAIQFNKDSFQWEALGDADEYKNRQARHEYNKSPIVRTIKKLLEQGNGRWDGTAKELLTAGKFIANTYLAVSAQDLGYALKPLGGPLFEYDGILYTTTPNGNAGKVHHFYYSGNEINDFTEIEEPAPFD